MSPESIPVELVGVRIELPTNTPIVLLREVGGNRHLPIFIGTGEATAIAFALEGVEPQRPMTHDLLRAVVEALGATVNHVLVTALRDGIYFADLVLDREATRSGCRRVRVTPSPSPHAPRRRSSYSRRCSTRPESSCRTRTKRPRSPVSVPSSSPSTPRISTPPAKPDDPFSWFSTGVVDNRSLPSLTSLP